MISANDLRNTKFSPEQNGYNVDEVNAALSEAAETIEGYINENKELYRKMELLAKKIEEYREEEDSIKSALITAQKMADKLEKESKETAAQLIDESNSTAEKTIAEANENAEKIVGEARAFSSNLINEKTQEADSIIVDAEKKANDAINSSKVVAQNILDQAKEISDDLIEKSKAEAEAYKILAKTVKSDAKELIAKLIALYSEQLEVLNGANLDSSEDNEQEQEVEELHSEVNSLVNEMDEIQSSIPEEVVIEEDDDEEEEEDDEDEDEEEETEEEAEYEKEIEEIEEFEAEVEEEPQDPMKAVEAFSADEITPIDISSGIPEIEEEAEMEGEEDKSLFDDEGSQPFESYFNVNSSDAHYDRSQTISLVPPEDDEDDQPKFKGFFKKKK
ncbi:MAG: DivIVA domain-containing protein [Eubacterium sp.]|nr:DivIVA domain-containing protein [Eubacterium sp.]